MTSSGQRPRVDDELEWFDPLSSYFKVERRDGVPVLYVRAPGPVRGGILFRVGAIDESIPQRGLTHMVEHLALHGQLGAMDHRNGSTGTSITQFVASGSEEQVVAFLNHVCASLKEPPLDRLEAERSILKVEAQCRQASTDARILDIRYGAGSFALPTFLEFATNSATAEDVVAWANTWFVNGNAVAWITTDRVPAGLDLSLPEGLRRTLPSSTSPTVPLPVWIDGPAGIALVESVVARSTEAIMFSEVLSKALFRKLRLERGLSYSAVAQYELLDAERARILVYADSERDVTSEFVEELSSVLMSLKDGAFEQHEIEAVREQRRENARFIADSPDQLLAHVGYDFLLGGESWDLDEEATRREGVAQTQLQAAAGEFWSDSIWQLPGSPPPEAGLTAYQRPSAPVVSGLSYCLTGTNDRLTVGDHGVSLVTSDGSWSIVFDDCVLALRWGDGGRVLVGRDGTNLSIEPSRLALFDSQALARLDALTPSHVVVDLPARSENVTSAQQPKPPGADDWAFMIALLCFAIGISALVFCVMWGLSIGQLGPNGASTTVRAARNAGIAAVIFLSGASALTWAWIRRRRWMRTQSKRA